MSRSEVNVTVGGGGIVGAILSYALNQSVGWAIVHFIFGWFYVIYALICRSHEIIPALKAMFS